MATQSVDCLAQWLSWLERRPVTAEVESSSLFWVVRSDVINVSVYVGSANRHSTLMLG